MKKAFNNGLFSQFEEKEETLTENDNQRNVEIDEMESVIRGILKEEEEKHHSE